MTDFPNLTAAKTVVLDLETYDPNIKQSAGWATGNGRVIGVAVGTPDLPASYYAFAHEGDNPCERGAVLRWVGDILGTPGLRVVGHNLSYDYGWLRAEGLKLPRCKFGDTMMGAALLNEDMQSYSLDELGRVWLEERKNEGGIIAYAAEHHLDPKSDLYLMPPSVVAPYAAQDVDLTAKLWTYEQERIVKEGICDIAELEYALIEVMVEMRRLGVRVDLDALDKADQYLAGEEARVLHEIKTRWGADIKPFAASSIARMCDKIGVQYGRTKEGQPQFTAEIMGAETSHEALKMVLQARQLNKARTTFIKSYKAHQVGGRIHAQIHQLRADDGGTITGRLSYSDPNLQQVPSRDLRAKIIRKLFIPEEGQDWIRNDYSQQEPRLTAHYAFKMRMEGAEATVKQWRDNPTLDFHSYVAELTGLPRTIAKNINLGIVYGMGSKTFARKYGGTVENAKNVIKQHRERLPYITELADACQRRAEAKGIIRTILNRPARFECFEPVGGQPYAGMYIHPCPKDVAVQVFSGPLRRAWTYTALNRLIQGSAADQTKLALLTMYREGLKPALQVHDEINLSGDAKIAARSQEIMRDVVKLELPVVVDTKTGANWAECK